MQAVHRNSKAFLRDRFLEEARLKLTCHLFSSEPEIDFFVKDEQGRYMAASPTFFLRLGYVDGSDIVGTTDRDHFGPVLADRYGEGDRRVLTGGEEWRSEREDFCPLTATVRTVATTKVPVRNRDEAVIGLVGASRDLETRCAAEMRARGETCPCQLDGRLVNLMEYIRECPGVQLSLGDLARIAGCSVDELSACVRGAFGETPPDFVEKIRSRVMCRRLIEMAEPINRVSERCGFRSPSALSLWFRRQTGWTPTEFRSRWQPLFRSGFEL